MTKAPQPDNWSDHYDSTWDRLVSVSEHAAFASAFQYDALNRRIVKKVYVSGSLDHTEHNCLLGAERGTGSP